ncbi:MAG: signal peptide peptidase SppA [Bacteroidaceae bacterium]|nr:signal peptide peptidase SppA [Bacteroidaceae bacterium]
MKDFIKYTLATIVGIILCSIIMTVIGIISIAGMTASESMSAPIKKNSVLRIKLQGAINERVEDSPMAMFMGEDNQQIGLEDALIALKKASENDKVKGIYLEGGSLSADPGSLTELHKALVDFKESGKFIIAYGDHYSRAAYYLSSVADKVYMNPEGMLDWSGMASNPIFFKDLLDKLGVKMQVFKVGTYKSAVEPYINTEMSEANREQVTSFLTNIWDNLQKDVAQSRNKQVEALNALADSMVILADPETSVKGGLVDKLAYLSEVKDELRSLAGLGKDDDLNFVGLSDVASSETLKDKESNEIAVYYAYGEIVESAPEYSFNQEHMIIGEEMMKDLQKLRKNKDIKAVVIRVNSPGGSAYASEQIWHEVELLKAEKPVIISMGGLAASGGYYISCGANKIIAEPTTLTGSIGIFGMIPDASELLTKKIGVKFDMVKTNAMSDFGAMGRPFNETESKMMQAYINKGYELFTSRVAQGRGMKQDDVKKIAEGRVWTGEQGLEIGLVDQLGTLDDAIAEAAKAAKIEKYSTGRYPEPEPWYASLLNKTKTGYLDGQMRQMLGEYYTAFSLIRNISQKDPIQARLPYDLNIK